MHETMRAACEYAILKSASVVAVVVTSREDGERGEEDGQNVSLDTLHGALRFEMIDPRGACASLAPLEELLCELEPRDLADAGVISELHRLAPAMYVRDVCQACAYLVAPDRADDAPTTATVSRLVFDNVDLSDASSDDAEIVSQSVPKSKKKSPPASADAVAELRLPTEDEILANKSEWTKLQHIAHELIKKL